MNVPVRVPWRAGSASNSGAWSTVKFGSNVGSALASGRMNMFRTNAMCHALGTHVAHRESVLGIGAAVEILDEQVVAGVQVGAHVGEQRLEVFGGDRLVHLAPVDVALRRVLP